MMTEEKKIILSKIDNLINRRKLELINELPSIHEIDDGIIIRFFTNWENCVNDIKYKRIVNDSKPKEIVIFYFLPKGAIVKKMKRNYIKNMTCLSGKLEIVESNNTTSYLTAYNRFYLNSNEFHGIALEDTYVITSN